MTAMHENHQASWSDFESLDIRVATIHRIEDFPEAKRPAWKLWLDFGPGLGVRKSSAQIISHYDASSLQGKQVLAVVNFPPKQIGNFMSECLVLGIYADDGVVLITPDKPCKNGDKLG
jgi:tRNA-binding protein